VLEVFVQIRPRRRWQMMCLVEDHEVEQVDRGRFDAWIAMAEH
jgi:hypothetical protein